MNAFLTKAQQVAKRVAIGVATLLFVACVLYGSVATTHWVASNPLSAFAIVLGLAVSAAIGGAAAVYALFKWAEQFWKNPNGRKGK